MRKSVLGIVVLILIAFGVSPYFIGRIAQSRIDTAFNNAELPGAKVKVVHYERGYFNSNVRINVTLTPPNAKSNQRPITSTIEYHLQHGPLVFGQGISPEFAFAYVTGKINLELPGLMGRRLQEMLKGQPLLKGHGTIKFFSNAFDLRFNSAKFDYKKPGFHLVWGGFKIKTHDLTSLKQRHDIFDIAPITFKTPKVTFKTKAISGFIKLDNEGDHNFKQVSAIRIPELDFQGREPVTIKDFKIEAHKQLNGDKFSANAKYTMAKLTVGNIDVGPMDLRLKMKDFSMNAFHQFQAQLNMAKAQAKQNPRMGKLLMRAAIISGAYRLLGSGGNIHLEKFKLNTAMGKIDANANFKFKALPAKNAVPRTVIKNAKYDLHLQLPIELAQMGLLQFNEHELRSRAARDPKLQKLTPQQKALLIQHSTMQLVNKLVEEGYLKIKGQDYVINYQYPAKVKKTEQLKSAWSVPMAVVPHIPKAGATKKKSKDKMVTF